MATFFSNGVDYDNRITRGQEQGTLVTMTQLKKSSSLCCGHSAETHIKLAATRDKLEEEENSENSWEVYFGSNLFGLSEWREDLIQLFLTRFFFFPY